MAACKNLEEKYELIKKERTNSAHFYSKLNNRNSDIIIFLYRFLSEYIDMKKYKKGTRSVNIPIKHGKLNLKNKIVSDFLYETICLMGGKFWYEWDRAQDNHPVLTRFTLSIKQKSLIIFSLCTKYRNGRRSHLCNKDLERGFVYYKADHPEFILSLNKQSRYRALISYWVEERKRYKELCNAKRADGLKQSRNNTPLVGNDFYRLWANMPRYAFAVVLMQC